MKIVRNNLIPFGSYRAINLFGILFCKREAKISPETINHEMIHTAQMKEMLYIPFYIWYVMEWLVRLVVCCSPHKAYRTISFEQEAYTNEGNGGYLASRKHYAWFKFI